MARPPRVFAIAPGLPFLDVLATAILNGELPGRPRTPPGPMDLPNTTILLPTRRAARALQGSFLSASRAKALLLPRIRSIADGDEDHALLNADAGPPGKEDDAVDLPPAIGEIERRLVLTQLILTWFESSTTDRGRPAGGLGLVSASAGRTPAQAARLAAELARLMDAVETEGASFSRLDQVVPADLAEHWQGTLDFIRIALHSWPNYLRSSGKMSAAARRNASMREEARLLASRGSPGSVIIAGVNGSIPATAELMRAVMQLDSGAVVLPGLDMSIDEDSWAAIRAHPEHPQFGLARVLTRLGLSRAEVEPIGTARNERGCARARLVSESMRPASTTDRWAQYTADISDREAASALEGLTCLELPTAADEAEAVALILREAAETPGRTAALVTPDRQLARSVASRLEAWRISVDDSGGVPFGKTPAGSFLDLAIEAAARDFSPIPLMAVLKHPLSQLGLGSDKVQRGCRAIELAALRSVYVERGLDGINRALERAARSAGQGRSTAGRLSAEDWTVARDVARKVMVAFDPLAKLYGSGDTVPIHELAAAHAETADRLAAAPPGMPAAALWSGDAGQAASMLFEGILQPETPSPSIAPDDYAGFYRGLVENEVVRSRGDAYPRLSIWGPLEARLQHADVMVLGGLNEGTWPAAGGTGPWLNGAMREAMGLPAPEQKIGLAAQDVAQMLCAPRVYLTRACKAGGSPTVPSRWLLRLQALTRELQRERGQQTGSPWLEWARARDHAPRRASVSAPAPRPPVALRPRKLSISDVETWIANPYAIFASKVLSLRPLAPLGQDPDAALRGSLIHAVMSRFAKAHPTELPTDCRAALAEHTRAVLAAYCANPRVAAFWMARLGRFNEWFAATEAARRSGTTRIAPEAEGALVWEAPAGPFTLTARADRIDVRPGGVSIFDYKLSANLQNLTCKAQDGLAPQLGLEAAIAAAGAFAGIGHARTVRLAYISASGGVPPGAEAELSLPDLDQFAADAQAGLRSLVARFDDRATPYRAIRRARFSYDYDSFAHLARAAEWAGADDAESAA